jgi:hypothetical protein
MIYCIVEGQTDKVILSIVLNETCHIETKIIVTDGFPSMPAVARTIMSFMNLGDKVMIVCDQDNFQEGKYGRDMLNFLLRGAMNNNSFELFTFDPNIDKLISKPNEAKTWKRNHKLIETRVRDNINIILQEETMKRIVEFAQKH